MKTGFLLSTFVLDKKSGGVGGVLDLMPCTQISRATFRRRFG